MMHRVMKVHVLDLCVSMLYQLLLSLFISGIRTQIAYTARIETKHIEKRFD